MKLTLLKVVFIYLLTISTYTMITLDHRHILWLCKEDGPIENLGALFFIIASGLYFIAFFHSSAPKNKTVHFFSDKNIFYLLLAVLFLLCFGEEISWGQRVFSLETPKLLQEMNAQKEINLHNLWLFSTTNPDGSRKSEVEMLLNMNRLFSIFWLLFCVITPVACRISGKINSAAEEIGIPLTPLWIGALFLTHSIVFHIIYNYVVDFPYGVLVRLNELKECNYAFIFTILAYEQERCLSKPEGNRACGFAFSDLS